MPLKKRIALFLDGTWNTVTSNTNVWRLKALFAADDGQTAYYSAGVGTQEGDRVLGGMFGFGLDQEVIDAYEWLVEHYNTHDDIFIFGFSRGAYTARSLSGLISKCGLLQLGAPLGVGELFHRYRRESLRSIRQLKTAKEKGAGSFTVEEEWMLKYCSAVPVKFVGVWDTVGALGIPFGDIPLISRRSFQFLETDLRANNLFAYHALAIDEHRRAFRPTLWTQPVPKSNGRDEFGPPRPLSDVEQRWFVGAHANVGGGYDSDLLAQIPLKWLMGKAIFHGLKFRSDITLDESAVTAPLTDSYASFVAGFYKFVSPKYYRPIGQPPETADAAKKCNINETIDSSVFERWQKDPTYRPPNLVQWANAHQVDLTSIKQSVTANDLSVAV